MSGTLSIVTSLYNSAAFLPEFHRRCADAAARVADAVEFVLVNDGSPDDSLRVALELRAADPRIRVVDLSRNFGHHRALMTGLAHATGDLVFLLDCDLEEDPAWLIDFHAAMQQSGADVIYGVQQARRGGWWERTSGRVFFELFNRMLTHPIPANVVTARLMTARYVRALVSHRDREICLAALWVITGFEQRPFPIRKGVRSGAPAYTVRKRISVLVNALTSFSNRPLIYIFHIGIGVMVLSLVTGAVLLYRSLTGKVGVPGWASIMVSIWFLGGLTIFCLGIIGVYLAKVFTETKQRPYTIVRTDYGPPADRER